MRGSSLAIARSSGHVFELDSETTPAREPSLPAESPQALAYLYAQIVHRFLGIGMTSEIRNPCLAVAGLVVGLQQIQAEVAVVIAPHRMDMVGVVLGVVVLDQENWRLHTIIVRSATINRPGPGE